MSHCQIILLHHDCNLVHSVLDQFEESIIDQQDKECINKQYQILQSKRKLASFISQHSLVFFIFCYDPLIDNNLFTSYII